MVNSVKREFAFGRTRGYSFCKEFHLRTTVPVETMFGENKRHRRKERMRNEAERPQQRWQARVACGVVLLLPSLLAGYAACAQSAVVRVNQAGYVTGAPKRAYLMSTVAEAGASFIVLNSAASIVFSAPVGANPGTWGAYKVYALDFDAVSAVDT